MLNRLLAVTALSLSLGIGVVSAADCPGVRTVRGEIVTGAVT